jgi:peptide/nickel transport system permease protein
MVIGHSHRSLNSSAFPLRRSPQPVAQPALLAPTRLPLADEPSVEHSSHTRRLLTLPLVLLLAGLLGASLIRFAPGFGVDERELDARLSAESIQAIRQESAAGENLLQFYGSYLGGLLSGDLGVSRSLQRPVGELLGERLPISLRLAAGGLLLAWGAGMALALAAAAFPGAGFRHAGAGLSSLALSVPAAALALVFLHADWPVWAAAGIVVFPRVYSYCANLLDQTARMPHVLLARAKGASQWTILSRHILAPAFPHLIALAGISVSIALGALIPLEVLCDVPGIGQLAWLAATGRDLPMLVSMTLLVATITISVNALSDLLVMAFGRRA